MYTSKIGMFVMSLLIFVLTANCQENTGKKIDGKERSDDGVRIVSASYDDFPIQLTEKEWKERLEPEAYHILSFILFLSPETGQQ